MNVLSKIPQYWKAIIAFVAPAASVIVVATLPSSAGGGMITKTEWIGAAAAAIITSAGVAAKGNAPKPVPPANDEAA